MEYALQSRTATAPLLPHSEQARPASHDEHDEHGKHTKWIVLVPKYSSRQVFHALLGLLALVLVVAGAIASIIGVVKYRKLAFPHRAVHASLAHVKDGRNFVAPYFDRSGDGHTKDVKMVMTVWFREGTKPLEPEPDTDGGGRYWMHDSDEDKRWFFGGQGYVIPDRTPQLHAWEAVWTGDMEGMNTLEEDRRAIARVTLPGRVLHSLVLNPESALVATFALVPLTSNLSDAHLNFTSSRPISAYGSDQAWPLPWGSQPPTPQKELNDFLAHSATGHQLRVQMQDWRAEEGARRHIVDVGPEEAGEAKPHFMTFLSVKTGLFGAHDYPKYGEEGFEMALTALREFKASCAQNPIYYVSDCDRAFRRDGHFENMLEVERAGKKEWKYGPYVRASPGPSPLTDFIRLPNSTDMRGRDPNDVPDFSYDWHVSYQSASPARLSFIEKPVALEWWGFQANSGDYARVHDSRDLYNAFLGVSYDPQSRPIARGVVGFISRLLGYLAIPLVVHYWLTRKTTTGIAILTQTGQSIVYLISYIVIAAVDIDGIPILTFIVVIGTFLAIIAKQLKLCFRPEFKTEFYPISTGSNLRVPVPVAVRFRHHSVAEASSFKEDARFSWWLRLLIMVITFAVLRFAPAPPPIVSARKWGDVMHGFGGAMHWDSAALAAIHIFKAIQSAVWFGCQLSQILLNYRLNTFAGNYALTAQLLFASQLLSHITQIFVNWFGRPQLMQPFTTWDVVTLLVMAVTAVQAILLPRVDQKTVDPVS